VFQTHYSITGMVKEDQLPPRRLGELSELSHSKSATSGYPINYIYLPSFLPSQRHQLHKNQTLKPQRRSVRRPVYFVLSEREIRNWMKPRITVGDQHNRERRALRVGLENHGLGEQRNRER